MRGTEHIQFFSFLGELNKLVHFEWTVQIQFKWFYLMNFWLSLFCRLFDCAQNLINSLSSLLTYCNRLQQAQFKSFSFDYATRYLKQWKNLLMIDFPKKIYYNYDVSFSCARHIYLITIPRKKLKLFLHILTQRSTNFTLTHSSLTKQIQSYIPLDNIHHGW